MTTLIILNGEMNNMMKIVKSLEESILFMKDASKTIKNEASKQTGGFLRLLVDTLGASVFGNLLAGKGAIRASQRF